MANTYTPNIGLGIPAVGDTGWSVPIAADFNLLDAVASIGQLAVSTTETPSASLNVKVSPGNMASSTGVLIAYAGTASLSMTASTTVFIWLSDSGSLTTGAAWPAHPTMFVPLAKVVAGTSTITSISDQRTPFRSLSQ